MRAFRPSVPSQRSVPALPIVSALLLGTLLLSSCDSGVDFSSLDNLSSDSAPVAKVRAWHDGQMQDVEFLSFAGKSGDSDSLALVEKFPPDWSKAVLLSGKDGSNTMATMLGQYTDEKYDTTYYHVRTILFDLDASGDVESSNIVVFSSLDELQKDGFDTYARKYLAKDFGDIEMIVSRYTIGFEAVDAFLYRSGQIPLELSMSSTKEQIESGGIGKTLSNISSDFCFLFCRTVDIGTDRCVYGTGDSTLNVDVSGCWSNLATACSNFCFSSPGGGSGGSSAGGGGGGGTPGGEGTDEDECSCSAQEQCDLAEEYSSGEFTCSDFKNNHGDMVVIDTGTENGKHGSYGYIHRQLPVAWGGVRSFIRSQGVNNTVGINSGYRCPTGNARVNNSASGSRHKTGRGLDIQIYDANVWTDTLKSDIVEFNQEQYPNSDAYAADRRPAEGKTGHVHISI